MMLPALQSGNRRLSDRRNLLEHVARVFADEWNRSASDVRWPAGAATPEFSIDMGMAYEAVRRIYEVSRSLPTASLDDYRERIRALPKSTEAERLVVQRIG